MKHNRITKAEDNFRQPVFWQTPCCTFALPQAEQEGKLFGRLASVLWGSCACQCACLVALANRDFAYLT